MVKVVVKGSRQDSVLDVLAEIGGDTAKVGALSYGPSVLPVRAHNQDVIVWEGEGYYALWSDGFTWQKVAVVPCQGACQYLTRPFAGALVDAPYNPFSAPDWEGSCPESSIPCSLCQVCWH